MNKLWFRLSLAFALVTILVIGVLGVGARRALANSSIGQDLPPDINARWDRLRKEQFPSNITAIFVVGGLVATAAGVWASRTLTAPMSELGRAAQAIGRRDLSRRVAEKGTDEMRALARGFNDMAQQLGEAESLRQQMLADVAHELRNPLHVLQGNLQAILDNVYPMSKEEIARLSDQTRHLTTLVDDLHELAQAEARRLPLDRRPVDMGVLVKDSVAIFQPIAMAEGVTLQVELLGTIPSLTIDAMRIRQVMNNLLSNALRHTTEGGKILVQAEAQREPFCVSVQDDGAGIDPAHLEYVFDRFYRTDSARSRDKGGTGLGLAIVRAIVAAHGGHVAVASPGIGKGSTFTIQLPLDEDGQSVGWRF